MNYMGAYTQLISAGIPSWSATAGLDTAYECRSASVFDGIGYIIIQYSLGGYSIYPAGSFQR